MSSHHSLLIQVFGANLEGNLLVMTKNWTDFEKAEIGAVCSNNSKCRPYSHKVCHRLDTSNNTSDVDSV